MTPMAASENDHAMMAHALRLAARGRYTADPNPRVGCVLVRDARIVGEGWHERTGGPHAEAVALGQAGALARGATAYVTLEPCSHHGRTPPCADALIGAGVSRVVIASRDPNPRVAGQGVQRLHEAGIEIRDNVLRRPADELNAGFISRMVHGRPRVTVKIAASLDGRTALAGGDSKWISGEAARADVQKLRAASSAILTGVGTVLADDPSLNVRVRGIGDVVQPARVVVDSSLRMSVDARLLALPGDVVVFAADAADHRRGALQARGASVETLPGAGQRVDLVAAMRRLGALEYNTVLVEAGPTLNGALLAAGLVDEVVVYQAAHILGDSARGMFAMPGPGSMADRIVFRLDDVRRVGADIRLTYTYVRPDRSGE